MLEIDYLTNLKEILNPLRFMSIAKLIRNDVSFSDSSFPIHVLFFGMIHFTVPSAKRTMHFLDCSDSVRNASSSGDMQQDNLKSLSRIRFVYFAGGHSVNLINHALCIT